MVDNTCCFGDADYWCYFNFRPKHRSSSIYLPVFLIFIMSAFLSKWKKIVKKVTSFQADVLFSIIFFLFILPIGFLTRGSLGKRFGLRLSGRKNSYWIRRDRCVQDLDWARKQ